MSGPFLIYGATGYTGKLIAERVAREAGVRPVLAGRDESKTRAVAEPLGLDWRAFSLQDPAAVRRHVEGMKAVLHIAGPFSKTSRPMVDACLAVRASYLDVTGELEVFEAIYARDEEARRAGVSLIPGVGFDVVPTDCLAKMLHEALPSASSLELGIAAISRSSPGTAKTGVELLAGGGKVRREGRIVDVPLAHEVREVPFADRARTCISFPWADLASAYRSTKIPDITVFLSMPPRMIRAVPVLRRMRRLLALGPVQRGIQKVIEKRVQGPTETQRARGVSRLWGRVRDDRGGSAEGRMTVPEGYDLTVVTAIAAARRVLAGDVPPGATSPSLAFGARFITEFDGVTLHGIEKR